MKVIVFILAIVLISSTVGAQTYLDSTVNSATKRIQFANANQFSIGSYGEAHYNQKIDDGTFQNGKVDLHRVILFMGYKFNKNLQFFAEIEFEHVAEVYVEQAFINYSVNSAFNVKAGVILIPIGYVNEFHEPTLFNGVERPNVAKYVIPTTWREMGVGFHGLVKQMNIKYQAYMVNGFKSYDGSSKLSGSSGLRSARQKAANAIFRTPSFTGKVSFYGLNGLRLGLSGYYGNTETTLYNGLERNDQLAVGTADSTIVGVGMVAMNAHYRIANFQLTAVGSYTKLSNTGAFNSYTSSDVGKEIFGYYAEVAYRQKIKSGQSFPQLIPFVRYENYDTHYAVEGGTMRNASYHREELTAGVGFQITPGTIIKADYQWVKNEANPKPYSVLNIGFGYWF